MNVLDLKTISGWWLIGDDPHINGDTVDKPSRLNAIHFLLTE